LFKKAFTTKSLVYGGLSIALSFVLSFVKIYHLPQGGSVTAASMLPLFVYSYIFGPIAGITASCAYGLLQLIQEAYVVHWVQFFLDYPLAFGALGIAGFFAKHPAMGAFVGGLSRFLFHFISGFVFFASYAPKGTSPVFYSFTYNISYILPEILICIVILSIPQVRETITKLKKAI